MDTLNVDEVLKKLLEGENFLDLCNRVSPGSLLFSSARKQEYENCETGGKCHKGAMFKSDCYIHVATYAFGAGSPNQNLWYVLGYSFTIWRDIIAL